MKSGDESDARGAGRCEQNTGWKPMLHCFPDCRAISQSPSRELSACTRGGARRPKVA
jgi:hypothetical protein